MKQITDAIRAKIVVNFNVQPGVSAAALAKKFKVEEQDVQVILDELIAEAAKAEAAQQEQPQDETPAGGNAVQADPEDANAKKQITDEIRAKIMVNFAINGEVTAEALAEVHNVEAKDVQVILDELIAKAIERQAAGGDEESEGEDDGVDRAAFMADMFKDKQDPETAPEDANAMEQLTEATPQADETEGAGSLADMLKDMQEPETASKDTETASEDAADPVQEEPAVELPVASANPTPEEINNKLQEMLAASKAQAQANPSAPKAPKTPGSQANPNATPRTRVTTHTIASCPSVIDGQRVQRRNTSIPDRAIIILTSVKARIAWLTTDVHFTNRTNEAAIKKALEELNRQKTSRDLIAGVNDWVLVVTEQKWEVGNEVQLAKANYYDYYRGMGYTVLGKRPNTTVVNNVVAPKSEPYVPGNDAPVTDTPANDIQVETNALDALKEEVAAEAAAPEAEQEGVTAEQDTEQEA